MVTPVIPGQVKRGPGIQFLFSYIKFYNQTPSFKPSPWIPDNHTGWVISGMTITAPYFCHREAIACAEAIPI